MHDDWLGSQIRNGVVHFIVNTTQQPFSPLGPDSSPEIALNPGSTSFTMRTIRVTASLLRGELIFG